MPTCEQTHGADRVHSIISAETPPTNNSKIKHEHWKWYWSIEIIVELITQVAMIMGMLVFLSQYFSIEVRTIH